MSPAHAAPRLVRSWVTPKASKGSSSRIEGRGVHALELIAAGEVVAVKGGHITDRATVDALPVSLRDSGFPIDEHLWLAALNPREREGVMMLINHSCAPNVGMGGNVALVSMRDIAVGEELTIDYALFLGHPEFEMTCHCAAPTCRGCVTGSDWRRADLQERYRGWFAWWLQRRIDGLRPG